MDAQTAAAVQAALLSHPDLSVRVVLARSGSTSPEMLEGFAADESRTVRRSVAVRDDCPLPVLRLLAGDDDDHVRFGVLERPQLPADLIERFAGDPERGTRMKVANRDDCPPETLQRLASDPGPAVQARVAHNPRCPVDALDLLSRGDHPRVLHAVACHPNSTTEMLQRVVTASDVAIRRAVLERERDRAVNAEVRASDVAIRRAVLEHPNCPPALETTSGLGHERGAAGWDTSTPETGDAFDLAAEAHKTCVTERYGEGPDAHKALIIAR